MSEKITEVLCYGEILFDVFDDQKLPGGAPFNVSAHLSQLGLSSTIISSVGNDTDGIELIKFAENKGVAINFIQINEKYPTGTVLIQKDENLDSIYTITEPVAWDFIKTSSSLIETVTNTPYFVFGSLATRSETSRNTLFELLKHANTKIFDINLRTPHYDLDSIFEMMEISNVVKMNEEELNELSEKMGMAGLSLEEKLKKMAFDFNLEALFVTRGGEGACLYTRKNYYSNPGIKVEVVDTTGSGDSFLAVAIKLMKEKASPDQILEKACQMGSWVATQKGAIPLTRIM